MGREVDRLSARFVASTKAPGRHADGYGLYLQVDKPPKDSDQVAKRWVFVFQWNGARKEMGLGPTSLVDLKEARLAVTAARKLVAAGKNPIEERKAKKADVDEATFGDVADELLISLGKGWKNPKHADQWKMSLEVLAKPLRKIAVDAVDTEDVLAVLKPVWEKTPETASRLRGRIERVLDAAKAKGLRQGDNPARWRGHLSLLLHANKKLSRGHHAALPFVDVPTLMAELKERPATAARALEWTILTAARTGEVIGARIGEVNLEEALWVVPAERMKAGVEHRVPLPPRAVEIARSMIIEGARPTDYLFPGPDLAKPMSNMAMTMLLRRMEHTEITVHGFRSAFRDWAGETTNFAREVVEAALAHTVGNAVERAYRRGDALMKRRKLMEAWAGYCYRPAGGKVLQMQRPG